MDTNTEKIQLQKFGIIIGLSLTLLGGLFLWYSKSYFCSYFFVFSVIFLLLGVIHPESLRPVYRLCSKMAYILEWMITKLILIVLFCFVIIPTAVLAGLLRTKFLDINFKRKKDSYWIKRRQGEVDKRKYENRF